MTNYPPPNYPPPNFPPQQGKFLPELEVDGPGPQNRLTVLLRVILLIPQFIVFSKLPAFGLQGMRRRNSPDVRECRCIGVLVLLEEKKIGDRQLVQLVGNRRMRAQSPDAVADQQHAVQVAVIKRTHAEVIARAKQALAPSVPYRESKIAQQMLHTIFVPFCIGMQDQLSIGRRVEIAWRNRLQFADEMGARVNTRLRDDANFAVTTERLLIGLE